MSDTVAVRNPVVGNVAVACSNCLFYVPRPMPEGECPAGSCRADPPGMLVVQASPPERPATEFKGMFPLVRASLWCGAHPALRGVNLMTVQPQAAEKE